MINACEFGTVMPQRADSETRNVKTTTGDGGFSKDNHLKASVIIDDYVNMIQFKYN
jgi:hypothetical protein